MQTESELSHWLDGAWIATDVTESFPTYQATLLAVTGIDTAGLQSAADDLATEADLSAAATVESGEPDTWPHIGAWRDAYRAFGAKPSRTRVSAEALIRRAARDGLPRINPLVDVYNAISVIERTPIGGEDLTKYVGPARLIVADGSESFHTSADGEPIVEHPDVGEPIWCHDPGITCRRWNWRQSPGTAITDTTVDAFFIIDSLVAPEHAGAAAIAERLRSLLDPTGERSAVRNI